MPNETRVVDYRSDPKYQWFANLRRQCFRENITHSTILNEKYNEGDIWCPRTFDGFSCWDETPAATTAYQPCPQFIVGFDPKRYAYKTCTDNGTWFVHPHANKPWTNYTTCVDVEDLDVTWKYTTLVTFIIFGRDNNRNNLNRTALTVPEHREQYLRNWVLLVCSRFADLSLHFPILSVCAAPYFIFSSLRVLQCIRIRIHVHLFMAFALNNVLWIVWYRAVVNRVSVVQNNTVWCQVLHVVTNYFMLTSYVWMFCEGLHLHIALVVVFVKDEVAMRWFVILGWGGSLVIIVIYATVRFFTPGATERCWMDQSDAFWIIIVPVGLSLLASFVFLVNVVRVLLTKLHPAATQHASVAVRKAARAALILVPLFGLHFVLLPFRPLPDSPWEKTYQIVSALLTSLQGLCVAILFCFTNHDVVVATKTYLSRYRANNEGIPMTGVTGAESLVNTRDHIV